MSDNGKKAPKAVIEQEGEAHVEASGAAQAPDEPAGDAREGQAAPDGGGSFQDAAIGFIEGVGRRAWSYVDAHPHTALYGLIGFVLAVLILVVGLWRTIVIAVFVGIGCALGQVRDAGEGGNDFFNRLFGGKK